MSNFKDVQKGIEEFIRDTRQALKEGNWPWLLAALLTTAIATYPSLVAEWLPKAIADGVRNWWDFRLWGITMLVLAVGGLVLLFVLRKLPQVSDSRQYSAIKGLRPFKAGDAEVFARLERGVSLNKWLSAIQASEFRLGILYSTSGCGKTSFLRAGLCPHLEKEGLRCVYVKLTEETPLDTIRRAAAEQLGVPADQLADATTLPGLLAALRGAGVPAPVLLLDQFEQYFLHLRGSLADDALAQGLQSWYGQRPVGSVKLLLSLRDDFLDRLQDLLNLGFQPLPQDNYRLDKFSPEQATAVFRVMAGQAEMEFHEAFVLRMARQELATRDDDGPSRNRTEQGRISPVTVQILAAMLAEQPNGADRAFTEAAFNRLGGVDGLMERFLEQKLNARLGSRRDTAVKVLLALTDLDRGTRAGVLSIGQLAAKSGLTAAEAQEAAEWLEQARLLTAAEDRPEPRYELAHERLIAALQKVANRILTGAAQANQLLDRRVKEWLGNGRAPASCSRRRSGGAFAATAPN